MCPESTLTIRDIHAARSRISKFLYKTPIIRNTLLDAVLGCTTYWKLESVQVTNAFKVRGALNRILSIEKDVGIVAASSGNHGIGVAFSAYVTGRNATVVMPTVAPVAKQNKVKHYGSEVILCGRTYDQALEFAEKYSTEHGLILVPSFDDNLIIAGQGTIALEVMEDVQDFDTFVVPIGGGGLAAGVGYVLTTMKPGVRLYAVQSEAAPSSFVSRRAGHPVDVVPRATIADGIVVVRPGKLTFPIIQDTVQEILLVAESAISEAVRTLAFSLKVIAEPSAAVCLAAITSYPELFRRRKVVCILSGANVDHEVLQSIIRMNAKAD